jgi:C1A family cysteine protease
MSQIKLSLGLKPPRPEDLNFGKPFKKSLLHLPMLRPKTLDYRYGMPPVLNQGTYNTCGAHAGAALQYFFNLKRRKDSTLVSRRALYTQTKYSWAPNDVNNDDGLYLVDILKTISSWGYIPEYFWPYVDTPNNFQQFINPVTGTLWDRELLVKQWVNIPYDLESIKQALWQHGPLIAGFQIPPEWYTYDLPSSGLLPIPAIQNDNPGSHCMLIVGYSDVFSWLVIRNSWGQNWCRGGYAYIPYEVFGPPARFGWPNQVLAVASI